MPGKSARRHFSQLSEFERGLIIGMKTAGWSTCQVDRSECAVRNFWEQWTREGTHASENRVWSDQEDHEERRSKYRAASTCGPHSDSFNDTSRRRRSNCSTNNFSDTLQNQILNPSALSVHPL
ncbi:transposable element Tcb2 transposase [Trichonephila clavipes]|nr:transposable element Tcb2 transposase [Trichonephila clavipes]